MAFKIPFYDVEALERKSEEFLAKMGALRSIPLPIEEIIEFEMGISVIPVPGLSKLHQLHGFLSADMSRIYVDKEDMDHRLSRFRFTLAHELGHLVLHEDFYAQLKFSNSDEWKRVVNELSPRDNSFLEFHANTFAGMILVPRRELQERWTAAMDMAWDAGFTGKDSVAQDYMISHVAKQFLVSTEVVLRRLQALKLIEN
jgi:Zn-dependent peptidase ImmA (M78 family)